jgi:hypothetical protein
MRLVLRSRAFSVPKSGETQNDDAFVADDEHGRYAVADGATEGAFSGRWARQLARAFGDGRMMAQSPRHLGECLPRFTPPADQGGEGPKPWFYSRGLSRGSYSTILGVRFASDFARGRSGVKYLALAVGDSCLLHVDKAGEIRLSFPLETAAEFTRNPVLLSTLEGASASAIASARFCHRQLRRGETLLLATDAVAYWLLQSANALSKRSERVRMLLRLMKEDVTSAVTMFEQAVRDARDRDFMPDDDATLVMVRAEEQHWSRG